MVDVDGPNIYSSEVRLDHISCDPDCFNDHFFFGCYRIVSDSFFRDVNTIDDVDVVYPKDWPRIRNIHIL